MTPPGARVTRNRADWTRRAILNGADFRLGFVVAYPDSIDGRWNYLHGIPGAAAGPDDPGFLNALTDLLSETYNIDPGRRYLIGISNGGFMA
jgi:polyhydroxybutyrate depolymerase